MTFRCASGVHVEPDAPTPGVILIEDIAHGLSQICRFNGHTRWFWSVASHSLVVSHIVEASLVSVGDARRRAGAALGLLHDASEAYLGDVTSPLKRLPAFDAYRALEKRWMDVILQRFGLSAIGQDLVIAAAVKAADRRALAPGVSWQFDKLASKPACVE